jgi:hypothetical protein
LLEKVSASEPFKRREGESSKSKERTQRKPLDQSADTPAAGAKTRREGPVYHKTLVRSRYAPVNGLEMYYEIHGTMTTRPLVTIHPWLALANMFPSLTRNRQLIAVELHGHGRTADIDRPMTFEQHATIMPPF